MINWENGPLLLLSLLILCISIPLWWRRRKRSLAARWPTAIGYIGEIESKSPEEVTFGYTYKVKGKRYVGRKTYRFKQGRDAARFEASCRQTCVLVQYRPDKPGVSRISRGPEE